MTFISPKHWFSEGAIEKIMVRADLPVFPVFLLKHPFIINIPSLFLCKSGHKFAADQQNLLVIAQFFFLKNATLSIAISQQAIYWKKMQYMYITSIIVDWYTSMLCFPTIFMKGINFCDFLFAFLLVSLSKMGDQSKGARRLFGSSHIFYIQLELLLGRTHSDRPCSQHRCIYARACRTSINT